MLRSDPGHTPMKDSGIKLIYVLGASLAAYFAVGIVMSASLLAHLRLADIEFLIPGALILVGTIFLWFSLLGRYPVCRLRVGTTIFFLFGLCITGFASVAYPVLRTGGLWEAPGEQGGAVLVIIIFLSLVSQLAGFAAGFIPSALFIRRIVRLHGKVSY